MEPIAWLEDDALHFPDISQALTEPDGLLAAGGDLSEARLIEAYRHGIFPWYEEGQPVLWWSPDPRCVITPDNFKPHRSLAKTIRSRRFEVQVDQNFESVIDACQIRSGRESTWITGAMKEAYVNLYRAGIAHSIECYEAGQLVGGLYGISLGRLFFGESMFHTVTDASKVAFAGLMTMMASAGVPLVDCQMANPHLYSLGAFDISREDFRTILAEHVDAPPIDWTELIRSDL